MEEDSEWAAHRLSEDSPLREQDAASISEVPTAMTEGGAGGCSSKGPRLSVASFPVSWRELAPRSVLFGHLLLFLLSFVPTTGW